MTIIDQRGYELIKRPRRLAQYMPEIFAGDAEGSGDSIAKDFLKPNSAEAKPIVDKFTKSTMQINFGGDSCSTVVV